MKENASITINLNFIVNNITSAIEFKETIIEQVLNLDIEQISLLTGKKPEGENHG